MQNLNDYIYQINRPILFKNILTSDDNSNSAIDWTPEKLAYDLNNSKIDFRIGKRTLKNQQIQFENQCEYVEATLDDFLEWYNSDSIISVKNPFKKFHKEEYWAYADYKYMIGLFKDESCIDWKALGFKNRKAKESTLWVGTEEAFTPCHYDTYGYNLVAQIYGKKRWILFPPTDTRFMNPLRVPFEESTVYSEVNIRAPDLNKYKTFCNVQPFIVELSPGDVLYVPHNWWHHVECLELSISINTWVELNNVDNKERLKESLSKTLLQGLMESNFISYEKWLNTSESFTEQEDNLEIIKKTLNIIKENDQFHNDDVHQNKKTKIINEDDFEKLVQKHINFSKFIEPVDFKYFLENFTSSFVSGENSFRSKDENNCEKVLIKLAKALTNPLTIQLISSLMLEDCE